METNKLNQPQSTTKLKQSGLGIAGMIIGIISLLLSCLIVGGFIGIIGLILSIIGITQKTKKKGTAIAGIVLNTIAIFILILMFMIAGSSNEDTTNENIESLTTEQSIVNETPLPSAESIVSEEMVSSDTIKPEEIVSPAISKEEFIAKCEEIPYKTLARNPQDYIGQKIVITVKIEQILQGGLFDDSQYYRVYTNDEYDMWLGDEYFMYDERIENDMKILQDDILKVYGEFVGMETVTRALTNTKEEVPAFKAVYVELFEESDIPQVSEEILNDGTIDIDFGDFSVQYDSYELTTDYEKTPCIIVYFNFTNNSTESQNAGYCTYLKVFQDGVECDSAFIFEDNKYIDNYYKDITSGTTIKVGQAFVLNSENEILLEMSEYFAFTDIKDSMTISFE